MANWNGFRLFLFMASQGNSVSLGYIFRIYIIIFLFPLKSGVQEFQCYTLCCPLKYWSLWQFPLCKVTGHPNVTCCWHVVLVNSRLVHSPWLGSTGPHAPTWVLLAQTPLSLTHTSLAIEQQVLIPCLKALCRTHALPSAVSHLPAKKKKELLRSWWATPPSTTCSLLPGSTYCIQTSLNRFRVF